MRVLRFTSAGLQSFGICSPFGTAALGMPCGAQTDCAAGALCIARESDGALVCRAICDENHPCADLSLNAPGLASPQRLPRIP